MGPWIPGQGNTCQACSDSGFHSDEGELECFEVCVYADAMYSGKSCELKAKCLTFCLESLNLFTALKMTGPKSRDSGLQYLTFISDDDDECEAVGGVNVEFNPIIIS